MKKIRYVNKVILVVLCGSVTYLGCILYKYYKVHRKYYPVLLYYKYIDSNIYKYNAALFLIENIQYQYSFGQITQRSITADTWKTATDSLYWSTINQSPTEYYPIEELKKINEINHKRIDTLNIENVIVSNKLFSDDEIITTEFLISHIDNAIKVWSESNLAKHLSFDEFKEYILPYRSLNGMAYNNSGDEFNSIFAKYLLADTATSMEHLVNRYNRTIQGFRDLNGDLKDRELNGDLGLYAHGYHDCVDIANYGCNILRACGIPTVVEFNIGYREFDGKHFYCSLYNTDKKWYAFNPESSLPGSGDWILTSTLNVYRQLYGAQKHSPYFLKSRNEYVPEILDDPCIQDVTSNFLETKTITLPFTKETSNRLAYLATFNKAEKGVLPTTWGEIDTIAKSVHFKNALPNILYLPIYYSDADYKAFAEPFYVNNEGNITYITQSQSTADSTVTLVLNRKFPRKKRMIEVANNLIGSQFIGANKHDFSDAKVLLEIKDAPDPNFIYYPFYNVGKYRYYRFQASDKHPHANLSMLEWITLANYGYQNTTDASRPHFMHPIDTLQLDTENRYAKLMDARTWEEITWKSEYDGNMQTAPSPYQFIHFMLESPQIVTGVRFAPLNADNGITAGDIFELYYWDDGWKLAGQEKANYEYIEFTDVPPNKLYWLSNKTRGKEELPFLMVDKKQCFIYHDILVE